MLNSMPYGNAGHGAYRCSGDWVDKPRIHIVCFIKLMGPSNYIVLYLYCTILYDLPVYITSRC